MYGYHDDLQIYSTHLSANQVSTLYNNPGSIIQNGDDPVDPDDPDNPDIETFDIYGTKDLEDHTGIPFEYTTEIWSPEWGNPGWRDSDHRATGWDFLPDSIISDTETGSNVMKFSFSDTIINGKAGQLPYRGGDYWKWHLGTDYKELYMSHNVKLKPGFVFNQGGKFPGLNGGILSKEQTTELTRPKSDEGFTYPIMWKEKGGLAVFIYHPNMSRDRYGDTHMLNDYQPDGLSYNSLGEFIFSDISTYEGTYKHWIDDNIKTFYYYDPPGGESEWYNITHRVVVNTHTGSTANADGFIQIFINGKLVEDITGLILLGNTLENDGIDVVTIGVFFGGGENYHAPQRDEWILIDDVTIFNYKEGQEGFKYDYDMWPAGTVLNLPNWPKTE